MAMTPEEEMNYLAEQYKKRKDSGKISKKTQKAAEAIIAKGKTRNAAEASTSRKAGIEAAKASAKEAGDKFAYPSERKHQIERNKAVIKKYPKAK